MFKIKNLFKMMYSSYVTNFFKVLISVTLIPGLKLSHLQYPMMIVLLWDLLRAEGTLSVVAVVEENNVTLLGRRWNIRHLVLHRTVPTMKNCPEYCMVFKCPSWYSFRKLKILLIWVSFYIWWWSESQFIYWNKVHLHSLICVTFFKHSKTRR